MFVVHCIVFAIVLLFVCEVFLFSYFVLQVHPMSQLVAAVSAAQRESVFAQDYQKVKKICYFF
jgi:hypothetical protein